VKKRKQKFTREIFYTKKILPHSREQKEAPRRGRGGSMDKVAEIKALVALFIEWGMSEDQAKEKALRMVFPPGLSYPPVSGPMTATVPRELVRRPYTTYS
jgi:hypothetical protein